MLCWLSSSSRQLLQARYQARVYSSQHLSNPPDHFHHSRIARITHDEALAELAKNRTPIVYDAVEKCDLRPRTEDFTMDFPLFPSGSIIWCLSTWWP